MTLHARLLLIHHPRKLMELPKSRDLVSLLGRCIPPGIRPRTAVSYLYNVLYHLRKIQQETRFLPSESTQAALMLTKTLLRSTYFNKMTLIYAQKGEIRKIVAATWYPNKTASFFNKIQKQQLKDQERDQWFH